MGSEAVIALMSAVFGGAGLKALEVFLMRGKVKDDTATELRKELREEVTSLRTELRQVEKDLDDWKQKYYDLLAKHNELHSEFFELNRTLGLEKGRKQGNDSSQEELDG